MTLVYRKTAVPFVLTLLMPCGLGAIFGQAGPFSSRAVVSLCVERTTQQVGREFTVDLTVNLGGLKGTDGSGIPVPAVLGAFLYNIGFSPTDLEFLGVDNGTAGEFLTPPIFTRLPVANTVGFVGVVNTQTATTPRTDAYVVARARFRPLRRFSVSELEPATGKAPNPTSLSSALLMDNGPAGPELIGYAKAANLLVRSILRGDADENGTVDVSDMVSTIGAVFDADQRTDSKDCNQSGTFTVADVVCVLTAVFG